MRKFFRSWRLSWWSNRWGRTNKWWKRCSWWWCWSRCSYCWRCYLIVQCSCDRLSFLLLNLFWKITDKSVFKKFRDFVIEQFWFMMIFSQYWIRYENFRADVLINWSFCRFVRSRSIR